MLKKFLFPIIILALLGPVAACNSSSEEYSYELSSSAQVTAFKLNANKNVLDSLQNVFFSIDLVNAKIFNADSLPYGTNVSRLVPNITVVSTAQAVSLTYYEPSVQRDSVVNYLTNSTDSINFSRPVKLSVTSQDGSVKIDYEIRVNVHQQKSDSLIWYSMESAPIPSSFSKVKASASAVLNGKYYCLSTDGSSYCLAHTSTPDNPQWQADEVAFDFTPDVNSLRYSSDAVYILDEKGVMYRSEDFGNWTLTGRTWHYIYGGYDDQILGSVSTGSGYLVEAFPSGTTWTVPDGFPIEGTSVPTFYVPAMSESTQNVMLGGRTADGSLSACAWGFDGVSWINLSSKPLPVPLEDVTLVPYTMLEVPSSTWSPTTYPALLAMGGRNANGTVNRTVYCSRDWGMTWRVAPSTVQLPEEIPSFYAAKAFTYTTVMYPQSRDSKWVALSVPALRPGQRYMMPQASRAVHPVTQWNCPALYILGGYAPDGSAYNNMWRGVILEYTYVPVQ